GAIGRPAEVLVLDMGEPVRIADVARRMVAESHRPIRVTFTGLRPGEKLHELLFGQDEVDERPIHPQISHCPIPPLPPSVVDELDLRATPQALLAKLGFLCDAALD